MKSINPYLFSAIYDWLTATDLNPHLVVDVTQPGVVVPIEYVTEQYIVLSIYHRYVRDMQIDDDEISFYTKFNGKEDLVAVPYKAMLSLVFPDADNEFPLGFWIASTKLSFDSIFASPQELSAILNDVNKLKATIVEGVDEKKEDSKNITFSLDDSAKESDDSDADKNASTGKKTRSSTTKKSTAKKSTKSKEKPDFTII